MHLVPSCSCLYPIRWSQVLSWEWRCSWSSVDRRCSNYIWVINNSIAYQSASYIRDLTACHHTAPLGDNNSTPLHINYSLAPVKWSHFFSANNTARSGIDRWITWIIRSWKYSSLQWRHNERDGVSNHRCLDCLFSCLFRRRPQKMSKLRATVFCEGNQPVTGGFTSQRASNAESVSIWRNHVWYN